jgi:ATP-binding cassette, subfamily A (ABC1), member 3
MMIIIPNHYQNLFAAFFDEFDELLDKMNVLEYGISISTLEEVFLKVGHLEDPTKITKMEE